MELTLATYDAQEITEKATLARRAKWKRDREKNPEKARARVKRWLEKNPGSMRRIKFAPRLRKYGIDVEDWARMYHAQDGRCPGCRESLRDGWHTAIDHCHTTGKFRGLLCIRCNRSIGVLLESPATLRRLAAYLEGHR